MGLRVEVRPSFGEQSTRSVPKPPDGRLNWFEANFPHFPSIQEVTFRVDIERFGTRLLLAASALYAPFASSLPANAEDNQPGVKPEAITVMVDGISVDVSGAQTVPLAGGEEPNVAGTESSSEASVSSESIATSLKEQYGIDPLIWEDVDKKGNKVTRLFAVVGTPTFPLKAADYSEDISVNLSPGSVHTDITPGTTREQAIKKIMHDEDIPQILVLPGQTTHFAYFGVGPNWRTPYIYSDLVVKPDAYPNAIVWFYEEANTSYTLNPEDGQALYSMFFGHDIAQAMKMFNKSEVSSNTLVFVDETRDLAREILGSKFSLIIKPITLVKETTPSSA